MQIKSLLPRLSMYKKSRE